MTNISSTPGFIWLSNFMIIISHWVWNHCYLIDKLKLVSIIVHHLNTVAFAIWIPFYVICQKNSSMINHHCCPLIHFNHVFWLLLLFLQCVLKPKLLLLSTNHWKQSNTKFWLLGSSKNHLGFPQMIPLLFVGSILSNRKYEKTYVLAAIITASINTITGHACTFKHNSVH